MRTPTTWRWLGAAIAMATAVCLLGCEPGFRPETLVDDLRLLGVSAQPASLRPGESARLTALVLDPSRAAPSTVLWLGCEADPYNLNRSPCANPDLLEDPSALTGGSGMLPPGVSLIGLNDQATYTAPAGLFDVLSPDDSRRQRGTVGQIIAFAVAETVSPAASREELGALFERVQRKEIKSILALFRIVISQSPVRNENPVVDALLVDGKSWATGARILLHEGAKVTLDALAPDSSFEPYTLDTPTGQVSKTERILTAWYSTGGNFSEKRTALGEAVKTVFTAPGASAKDPVPERRSGNLYTVFRDTRGAQTWKTWPFYVCDLSLKRPEVTSVDWPQDATSPIILHGNDMSSVLDVLVDGVAIEHGAYSPEDDTFQGTLAPEIPRGAPRGTIHTRSCEVIEF